jgi:small conductance mechanosensitive channel
VAEVLKNEPRILTTPQPLIVVEALADSSVNIMVRVWVKQEDYWDVHYEMHQKIYDSFNAAGINFPYPQQTVHIVK